MEFYKSFSPNITKPNKRNPRSATYQSMTPTSNYAKNSNSSVNLNRALLLAICTLPNIKATANKEKG